MTIFGQAELFKTMNWPDPTRPGPTVTLFHGLFLGKYKRWRREILTQPLFKTLIYAIKNWNRYL